MPINPCTGAPGATPHWTCIAANPPGHASPQVLNGTGGQRSLLAGWPVRPVYQSDQLRTREGYRGACETRPELSISDHIEARCLTMRAPPPPPIILQNMRQNGVRAVTATCANCGRSADVNVDIARNPDRPRSQLTPALQPLRRKARLNPTRLAHGDLPPRNARLSPRTAAAVLGEPRPPHGSEPRKCEPRKSIDPRAA